MSVDIQPSISNSLKKKMARLKATKTSLEAMKRSPQQLLTGKRKKAPQMAMNMLDQIEKDDESGSITSEGRLWSQKDATLNKNDIDKSDDNCKQNAAKDTLKLPKLDAGKAESEHSKLKSKTHSVPKELAGCKKSRYSKSKSLGMLTNGRIGQHRDVLDIKRVNDFLRLLIVNHQWTVKQLAQNPEAMNPSRSFDQYQRHLKMVKRISE